ncbi:shieldin complex subunit 1 [Eudromia elegans]
MEGKWTSPSPHSEESSMLDLPSACDIAENFLPSHTTENSEESCFLVDMLPSPPTGENGLSAAVQGDSMGRGAEGGPTNSPAGDAALSWTHEHGRVGKALDSFYKTYCEMRPGRRDATCEAASHCLSQRISELAQQEGRKYALRCLQMAQVVLNRDGCRIFPNHPSAACFAAPAEGEAVLEGSRGTPGLSDDVLHLLSRQMRPAHSP